MTLKLPFSRSRPPRWALVALALAAAGVGVLRFMRPATPAAAPQAAAGAGFRPTREQWAGLKVAPVKTLNFASIVATDGAIAYNDDGVTPVFSPYSGRVTRLIAKPGDVVRQGAPLMAVEAAEFAQGRADLATAAAALDTARTQLKLAQANEKRQRDLVEAKAGAMKDWLQSQTDLATAENAVKSAAASLAAARNRLRILGKSDAEITALAQAPGDAPGSAEALVRAPIAGTVTQRQVGLGQYVNSASGGASTPVFSIGDLSTVWLVANVRESDAPALRLGQAVEVRVLALPGKVFPAKLTWIAPAVDPNTHRLPVRAEVKNPGGELKPMMFASFGISTSGETAAPAVPESAVMYEGEAARVFVVAADNSIGGRAIRTGRSRDGMIEVTAGLKAGERIVTSGTLFIDRAVEGD